jgi:hypothetical protein
MTSEDVETGFNAELLPPRSRSWIEIEGHVHCYKSKDDLQTIEKFVEPTVLTRFHDSTLADATRELNAIVDRCARSNTDPSRTLSFIVTPRGLMLVWAEYGAVGPHDDDATIDKALGIRD